MSIVGGVVVPVGPAAAVALTDPIPLATIGAAPRSGTLPNGVTWSVDNGSWNTAGQGYVIFGGATQTWSFDRPVSLRFSVRGLTGAGECMRVPVGSVLASLAPSHSYNPTTRLVCYVSNVPSADSFFTLSSTTALALVAVNGPTLGRGPGSIEVTFNEEPALSIVKSSPTVVIPPVGGTIPYSFLITNTGNVGLTGITVTDPKTTAVTCLATVLAPSASTTCGGTHTVVQSEIDAGVVTNTATVTGTPPSGVAFPPAPSNQVTITGSASPALSIVKSSTATALPALGGIIPYSFLVTNIGNVTMTGIAVTDTDITSLSCPPSTLAPGASMTCTGSYSVTQADIDAGGVSNIASVVGIPPSGPALPPQASNQVVIPAAQSAALAIVKASTTTALLGVDQVVPYTFTVVNTGNITISAITVTDAQVTGITCPAGPLGPGLSVTCTASHTVTQFDIDAGEITNTATVTGTPPTGPLIPPVVSNPVTITAVQIESLSILKSSATTTLPPVGATIPYEFLVTNSGNVTIDNITVTDPNTGTIICPVAALAPTAATTCTGIHTVTQADIDTGFVTNTAQVLGSRPDGFLIPSVPSNEVTIAGLHNPALSIVKSSTTTSIATPGQVVPYQFVVTNTGNVTISEIKVTDLAIAVVGCAQTTLPPGSSTNCTGDYVVTTADLDHGQVVNSATAAGTPPIGPAIAPVPSNTVTIAATQTPALTITKSTSTATITGTGQIIPFTFTVTNSGNVTIHDVIVTDPKTPLVACASSSLPAQTAMTCTADYTVTQADVDNGQATNTASVSGSAPDGSPIGPVSSNQVAITLPSPPSTTNTIPVPPTTVPAPSPSSGQLPATGSDLPTTLRNVAVLILFGGALSAISRRRPGRVN